MNSKKIIGIILAGFVLAAVVALVIVKFPPKLKNKNPVPVTVTYWGLWEPESVMRSVISDFETANPAIKINYIFQSQREYRERLQNALASGRGPDVFRIHNTWMPMFRTELASVPPEVYSASEYESTFYPVTRNDLQVGGNYMAIPLMIDGLALFTNDELFSQGGKTVPTSWEELRKTAGEMSVCDSEDGRCNSGDKILISGAALGTSDNVDHWQDILGVLMLQNNVNLATPVGQSAEESLQYYTIFNRADHIWDSSLPTSTIMFANGKLAMYFAPSWRIFDLQAINPKLKFSVHPIPQLPLDSARGEKPITWASYWAEGVSKKSTQGPAAWKWVKYLSSRETGQKLYQSAGNSRAFGEIYSRMDMQSLLSDPLVSPYATSAINAKSWYLVSNTFDGPTGINSKVNSLYAEAINEINQGKQTTEVTKTLSTGINGVLSQYGLATQIIPPTR